MRRSKKSKPSPVKRRRLRALLLLGFFALMLLTTGVVVAPHMNHCVTHCGRDCHDAKPQLDHFLCQSRCRPWCVFERVRYGASARNETQRPGKVRIGGVEIVAPELNFPIARLAKTAIQLRAPLAAPTTSRAARVDLRTEMARRGVNIKAQGDTPTCMAHALTSSMEFALAPVLRSNPALAKRVGAASGSIDLSRKHVHYLSLHAAIVCQRNNPRGSWALHAASAIAAEGTFREALWPWTRWDPTSKKWASCEEAVNGGSPSTKASSSRFFFIESFKYLPPFGIDSTASARSASDLEGILGAGHPVVLAVVLYPLAFDTAWNNGGHVHAPSNSASTPSALHYVLLAGYDRTKRHFIFANSWGKGFGSAGFGYLDYDYVTRFAIEGIVVETMGIRMP